jgi:hypothetical protein
VTAVGAFFTGIGTAISTGATQLVADAKQLGTDIITGIVDGITEGASQVATKITDTVGNALTAGADYIQSGSPSRLSARMIGRPIIEGVGVGALQGARAAARQTSQAITVAGGFDAPQGGRRAGGSAVFNSDISIQVSGGSAQHTEAVRTAVRGALGENRRATLAALTQVAPDFV